MPTVSHYDQVTFSPNLSFTLIVTIFVPKCIYLVQIHDIILYSLHSATVTPKCLCSNIQQELFGLFLIPVVLEGREILHTGQAVISLGELVQVAQAGMTHVCL